MAPTYAKMRIRIIIISKREKNWERRKEALPSQSQSEILNNKALTHPSTHPPPLHISSTCGTKAFRREEKKIVESKKKNLESPSED
jgi:hypothetical protein